MQCYLLEIAYWNDHGWWLFGHQISWVSQQPRLLLRKIQRQRSTRLHHKTHRYSSSDNWQPWGRWSWAIKRHYRLYRMYRRLPRNTAIMVKILNFMIFLLFTSTPRWIISAYKIESIKLSKTWNYKCEVTWCTPT